MNFEQIVGVGLADEDLRRRAAQHAALAEPLRLRITDLLMLSDLSSSELRGELRVESNLLAHHLGVLETAGLIHRRRSEGDRRRTYATLTAQAGESAPAHTPHSSSDGGAARVVFVCTGNSARSPFSAARWNMGPGSALGIGAVSAGTYPAPAPADHSVQAAASFGVDLSAHAPQQVGSLEPDDLLVIVCDRAYEELSSRLQQNSSRPEIRHWSVPNPGSSSSETAYADCFAELTRRVAALGTSLRI